MSSVATPQHDREVCRCVVARVQVRSHATAPIACRLPSGRWNAGSADLPSTAMPVDVLDMDIGAALDFANEVAPPSVTLEDQAGTEMPCSRACQAGSSRRQGCATARGDDYAATINNDRDTRLDTSARDAAG
jgi:hypothetical protein